MKVLVLGAAGMLGHKLCQVLAPAFDVSGTVKGEHADASNYPPLAESEIITSVNALEISTVERTLENVGPDVLVNCIGIIKSRKEANNRLLSVWVNSLFPHQLYQVCSRKGVRLIHISTDCVFSGRRGNYREEDPSDAEDIYGKTKYLGEVNEQGALTVRTSLVGRELSGSTSLVEWFLSNRGGNVNGFTNAIFSGFPTLHFSRIIGDIIVNHPNLSGLYHISSDPISKFELLKLIDEKMGLDIDIAEYPDFRCDRSLDSSVYRAETGFAPPPWEKMVDEFADDALQYQHWRQ